MHRGVLLGCLPWLLLLVGLLVALRLVVALSGGRWHARRLACLHQDEGGAVQSLSFVLTLPIFVMLLMLIVQASQLMIGQMVVEYAAIAAARAAIVWIPAGVGAPGDEEWENCISSYAMDSYQTGTNGGTRYVVNPGSPKYQKILSAAMLACAPIAPSQGGGGQSAPGNLVSAVQRAYAALAPPSTSNGMIPSRLANKLGYVYGQNNANQAITSMLLTFVHKPDAPAYNNEPPLGQAYLEPWQLDNVWYAQEFAPNEVGWQDSMTVTVFHQFALLPGPGRLLFGPAAAVGPSNQLPTPGAIQQAGNLYTYTLTASTTLGIEGEKSLRSFPYEL